MVAILGFMTAIILIMWLVPNSDIGRTLHRQLVERPLATISSLRRHDLLFFVIMAGLMLTGGEAVAVLGPEVVSAFALDLAIYVDAVLVTYALSAVAMTKRSGGWLLQAVMRCVRRMRPRKKRATRKVSRPRRASNDDDPAPAWLAA